VFPIDGKLNITVDGLSIQFFQHSQRTKLVKARADTTGWQRSPCVGEPSKTDGTQQQFSRHGRHYDASFYLAEANVASQLAEQEVDPAEDRAEGPEACQAVAQEANGLAEADLGVA